MSVKNKERTSIKSKNRLQPVCKWCGKPFKKHHNRQMYCSNEHRKYARQEQKRDSKWRRRRSLHIFKDDIYWGLGSGSLGIKRENDFNKERNAISNEFKNLNLKRQFF